MNLRFYENLCRANEEIVRECYKLKKEGLMEDYFIRNGFVKIVKKYGDKPKKFIIQTYENFIEQYDH